MAIRATWWRGCRQGWVLPPQKCPRDSKIVAKDGQDDVDGNDDRDLHGYDHSCFLKWVHGLNLAIKRLKMIPATQSITEPTTVGRSQLRPDVKISKTVALRTHPGDLSASAALAAKFQPMRVRPLAHSHYSGAIPTVGDCGIKGRTPLEFAALNGVEIPDRFVLKGFPLAVNPIKCDSQG
jgi:hypothetical protein